MARAPLGFGSDTTRPAGLEAVAARISLAHARDAVGVGRLVGDRDPELGGRRLGAVLDNRPERIGRLPVRDHEEADAPAALAEDVDAGGGTHGRIGRVGLDRRQPRLLWKRVGTWPPQAAMQTSAISARDTTGARRDAPAHVRCR